MAAIHSAYAHYLSTYAHTKVSRYDSHKKSELRTVYNNILKINKEAPLYKLIDQGEMRSFAIDIKESARNAKNVISDLTEHESDYSSAFQKKVASSSDENLVEVTYIGEPNTSDQTPLDGFSLEITKLASPQINLGNYLVKEEQSFTLGDYAFDVKTNHSTYEFQYTVNEEDKNIDVLQKLNRLVNTSGVGLKSQILFDDNERAALQVYSLQTGLQEKETHLFELLPDTSKSSISAMDTLGIHQVASEATNSMFFLNEVARTSLNNHFSINNMFEVTLKGKTGEGSPVQVGFKSNIDAIHDNINRLLDVYNQFIQIGNHYANNGQSDQLIKDIKRTAASYQNELEPFGIKYEEDGTLSIDEHLLTTTIENQETQELFSMLNQFKDSLKHKADQASLNPMQYVNKIMVEYKNPGKSFIAPYVSSLYSGLLLDRYC